jgi:membrane protein DedA with SNARE-associated domain
MTFIESTFIPIPAEITMIPAGYLVYQGKMNIILVMLASISGTLAGSWLSYWIALKYGRELLEKYHKYLFMSKHKIIKMEKYFEQYGAISTFTGRLLPGIRHYISFPAGLAKMNLKIFFLYTGLGGGIWMLILVMAGYFIGENEQLLTHYLHIVRIVLIVAVALIILWFIYRSYSNKPPREKPKL